MIHLVGEFVGQWDVVDGFQGIETGDPVFLEDGCEVPGIVDGLMDQSRECIRLETGYGVDQTLLIAEVIPMQEDPIPVLPFLKDDRLVDDMVRHPPGFDDETEIADFLENHGGDGFEFASIDRCIVIHEFLMHQNVECLLKILDG